MNFPTIKTECSDYIIESGGIPMYKILPSNREPFIKVKARHKKLSTEPVATAFNEAFNLRYSNIYSRAIFCNTMEDEKVGFEKYYVFPINGYKFMYGNNVKNTSEEYKSAFMAMLDIMAENTAINLLATVLSDDYSETDIKKALEKNLEIIVYNVPYFYAIKCSFFPTIEDYQKILYN